MNSTITASNCSEETVTIEPVQLQLLNHSNNEKLTEPARNLKPYELFRKEYKQLMERINQAQGGAVGSDNPKYYDESGMLMTENRMCRKEWLALTPKKKSKYEVLAHKDKQRFDEETNGYEAYQKLKALVYKYENQSRREPEEDDIFCGATDGPRLPATPFDIFYHSLERAAAPGLTFPKNYADAPRFFKDIFYQCPQSFKNVLNEKARKDKVRYNEEILEYNKQKKLESLNAWVATAIELTSKRQVTSKVHDYVEENCNCG